MNASLWIHHHSWIQVKNGQRTDIFFFFFWNICPHAGGIPERTALFGMGNPEIEGRAFTYPQWNRFRPQPMVWDIWRTPKEMRVKTVGVAKRIRADGKACNKGGKTEGRRTGQGNSAASKELWARNGARRGKGQEPEAEGANQPGLRKFLHPFFQNNPSQEDVQRPEKNGRKPGALPGHPGHGRKKQIPTTEPILLPSPREALEDPDFKKTSKMCITILKPASDSCAVSPRRCGRGELWRKRQGLPLPVE